MKLLIDTIGSRSDCDFNRVPSDFGRYVFFDVVMDEERKASSDVMDGVSALLFVCLVSFMF